jgi:hypothetical protein
LIALTLTGGCGKQTPPTRPDNAAVPGSAWFEDFTERAGVSFTHEVETSGKYLFSESIGSGAAFLDFDNDGRLDLYLIHNANPSARATNRLFHQETDGRFKDVSAGSGLDVIGYGNGLAVGDINNDGLPEVLITEYDRVRLFLNQGDGKFSDITADAGLTNRNWSVPAAFFDYDRDGWLDLVVGNYLDFDPTQVCPDAKGQPDFCGPHGFHSTITRLFHNLGARAVEGRTSRVEGEAQSAVRPSTLGTRLTAIPRFEDVTVSSGLARAPGKAMAIVCADFDGDWWTDIFITDDGLPNRLFMNRAGREGRVFKEEAVARGLAYTAMGAAAANMGIAIGDVNNDGMPDLFVPHLSEENHTLWLQTQPGVFLDDTARAGLLNLRWHGTGFGALFADFDCDGAEDLAVVNGRIRRRIGKVPPRLASGIAPFWQPYAEPSQLFANDGARHFNEISQANRAFCGEAIVGRGLICGDFDNDGAPDLLATGISGSAHLYRNIASPRGHWLGVRAIDPSAGGRDAYGAEIVIHAGSRHWWRLAQPSYSYASSNDPRVQVGLGGVSAVDTIEVIWPDGGDEIFDGGTVDRYLTVRKGSGRIRKEKISAK